MRRRRSLAALALAGAAVSSAAAAQINLLHPYAVPLPRELAEPIAFAWSGPIEGATRALAARLGYASWLNLSSGLPMPDPPPRLPVSVGFFSASPTEIVETLNRLVASRAVVILDPRERSIGVVYYGF